MYGTPTSPNKSNSASSMQQHNVFSSMAMNGRPRGTFAEVFRRVPHDNVLCSTSHSQECMCGQGNTKDKQHAKGDRRMRPAEHHQRNRELPVKVVLQEPTHWYWNRGYSFKEDAGVEDTNKLARHLEETSLDDLELEGDSERLISKTSSKLLCCVSQAVLSCAL